MEENNKYKIALSTCSGINFELYNKIISYFPCLELFFQNVTKLDSKKFKKDFVESVANINWRLVNDILQWEVRSSNNHIIFYDDCFYPKVLKEIYNPPIVLYAVGNLNILKNNALAIVGSRRPNPYGLKIAYEWSAHLAQCGLNIISGLAIGIDGAAHQGALSCSDNTIGVLGCGIEQIYPKQHAELYEKIKKNSLLISEFPLNVPPAPRQFPQRNRIISGLSMGVIVVEAALKSGSLNTAKWALEQNRAVMAVPGYLNQPKSAGCNYLIQQGAKLVASVSDVLEEINFSTIKTEDNSLYREILILISNGINTLDEISNKLDVPLESLTNGIIELEIAGKIKSNAGFYSCL